MFVNLNSRTSPIIIQSTIVFVLRVFAHLLFFWGGECSRAIEVALVRVHVDCVYVKCKVSESK